VSSLCCTDSEVALKRRFEEVYTRSITPTMRSIERKVCGSDFGGNSWTGQVQADALISALKLNSRSTLIDLGAGSGWPGRYLAKTSGCTVTLGDLPEIGLQIAQRRAAEEGLADRVQTMVADAADLPFSNGSFDAINHSDLLCCLVRKREVLEQCQRIVRHGGRMAFTVISLSPGLSHLLYERALENAPEFIDSGTNYQTLLKKTGWQVTEQKDLTNEYRNSCARQIDADVESRTKLVELFGADEARQRLANWQSKLQAIEDGLFSRELYVCSTQRSLES
jgi:ubiquinone/menaquinone biosynthesis C-methylase UbiE